MLTNQFPSRLNRNKALAEERLQLYWRQIAWRAGAISCVLTLRKMNQLVKESRLESVMKKQSSAINGRSVVTCCCLSSVAPRTHEHVCFRSLAAAAMLLFLTVKAFNQLNLKYHLVISQTALPLAAELVQTLSFNTENVSFVFILRYSAENHQKRSPDSL